MTNSLTVFLAPAGTADGVLAVLTDLSAAGLVDPFLWLTNPSDSTPPQALVQIAGGRARDVTIQQIVAAQSLAVVRICVIVPLLGPDLPLSLGQERFTADLLASTSGTLRTVRVRCVLARPGLPPPSSARIAVEGWHNILISPEDGRGPGMGHVQLPADATPIEVGRYSAPVVAGLLGLWSNLEHTPLDNAPVRPGEVVRLARSFYRKLETSEAEATLRQQLLAQDGTLPLPSDQRSQVVHVHDVGLAANTMAESFWNKHAAILKSARRSPEVHTTAKIGVGAALKMFFGFLWAAIKNAPGAWYARVVDSVSTGIAASVNKTVFGGQGSAFEVVVNGRTARGERADWAAIADASSQLSGALGGGDAGHHYVRTDLSAVWQDYSRAAMTLADAGARSTELPPVQVGANRGIIAAAADVVPGPLQRFTEIPGVIAANTEVVAVDRTDPLGISAFRAKLGDLERTREHGLQAKSTLTALDTWQRRTAESFGVVVGRRLAEAFTAANNEVGNLLTKLTAAQEPPAEPGRNTRLVRWIQITVLMLVLVTAAVGYLAYADLLKWWWAVLIGIAAYLLGFVLCLRAFMRTQQELFQLLNKRKSMISEREVDEQNLRAALRDLNRLSQAYGEYLVWSRALGAFIAAPLGPDQHRSAQILRVSWGLPMSTAVGFAAPAPEDVSTTVGYLRRDLFNLGWLSGAWESLVIAAQPPQPGNREASAESSPLWSQPGWGSGSTLDQWASALFAGTVTSTGADVVWGRAQHSLNGPMAQLVDTLVSHVQTAGGAAVPTDQFLSGIDQPAAPGGRFDRAMLTDSAAISGAGAIADDVRTQVRYGIGILCASTQLSDAIPLDSLTGGEPVSGGVTDWNAAIPTAGFEAGGDTVVGDQQGTAPGEQYRAPDLGGGFNF